MYKGGYKDGLKHGWGIFVWEDGMQYEGEWLNGKQHGKGRMLMPNGKALEGVWDEGKRLSWTSGSAENSPVKRRTF